MSEWLPMSDEFRAIHEAEAAMARTMRACLGSPSEQVERLERRIEELGQHGARGIDRTGASWWRGGAD